MIRQYFLLFLLVGAIPCSIIHAQAPEKEKDHKGYIGITAGPSFPVGNFGDSSLESDKSGLGLNGYQYSLAEFGIKFVPNFGLGGALRGAVIPFDVQALADGYAEEYSGTLTVQSPFTVQSTRWGYTGLFVGPIVSIPTKYIDVDFRFMPGLFFAQSPEITVTWDGEVVAYQDAAVGGSIGFSISAGIRVHLLKRLDLLVIADYLTARPTFTVTYTSGQYSETDTFGQIFTTTGICGGLAYRIF